MKKKNIFLILILISACLVRFLGFWVASFYIDEAILLDRARQIVTGEEIFNPNFVGSGIAYGMIISYLHAFFMKSVFLLGRFVFGWHQIDDVYGILKLSARFGSVLVGTGAVYFTYLSAKKLFNPKVGLFSALVLAFSFNHVAQSKYALVDVWISFFLSVALYFSAKILAERENLRAYFLGAVFSALAFALKYNFPVFLLLFAAHSLRIWQTVKRKRGKWLIYLRVWFRKQIFLVVITTFAVLIIVNPYFLLNPQNFIWQLKTILNWSWNFPFGARDLDGIPNFIWYLDYLVKVGFYYPFFAFVVGGMVVALMRYRLQAILLLSYPVVQLILLEIYTPRTDRYPVWWLSMLAIFAGLFLWKSFNFLRFKKVWRTILIFLIILPIFRILAFDFAVAAQKDTRQQAKEFLLELEKEWPIYFLVDVDGRFLSIKGGQFLGSHELIRVSFDQNSKFPHNIFRYPDEYVLISSFNYEEYLHLLRHNPEGVIFNKRPAFTQEWLSNYINEARLVTDFMSQGKLVKEFSKFWFENNFLNSVRIPGGGTDIGVSHNPNIKIYKIPHLKKALPTLEVSYYPLPVAVSRHEILSILSGASIVTDQAVQKGQVILTERGRKSTKSILQTSRGFFPPGEYLVKISLKMTMELIAPQKIYGFVTFGDQKIKENMSYQEIKGKSFKRIENYQTVSLPFKLSQISDTAVELTWLDENPVMVEKIEIVQTK